MLYRPKSERMWDTWIFHHNHVYYLFYIRITPGFPIWNGISVARSSDLLHWEEIGPVLEKHPDSKWLGTGMIVRAGDGFIMNFSEERPARHQVIGFAQSDDLLHWRRLETEFRPDPRWYEAEPEEAAEPMPRWDSLGVLPLPEASSSRFLAVLSANARTGPRGGSGVLGLCHSDDAVHWTCRPPATASMLAPNFEVPEFVRFGSRWYVLFATNSPAANRFDPLAGNSGGTYYVVSDAPEGPYVTPPGDWMLQGTRDEQRTLLNLYVGRPLQTPSGETLYYHHWASHHQDPNAWAGPPKKLVERGPWQLGLDWWEGSDALRGVILGDGVQADQLELPKNAGVLPVVHWSARDGNVIADHDGGSSAPRWKLPPGDPADPDNFTDLRDGRIFETTIRLNSGRALGLWIGTGAADERTAVSLSVQRQQVEILDLRWSFGPSPALFRRQAIAWPLAAGISHRLRLLVRREFLEIYLDDRYVHGYVITEGFDIQRLGFFSELGSGAFLRPRVTAMK